jgi:threonine dehydrogenase-like Zn-dependent dehydrogenase
MNEAIWFSAVGRVELRAETPEPLGPGDVAVAAIASAISHGTERLVLQCGVDAELPLDLPTLRGSYRLPIKYGYALVGRVTAVGAAVTDLTVGQLVAALHPHQRLAHLPRSLVMPLPELNDPVLGVFYANTETALTIVHDAAPRIGEIYAVSGLGTVGLLTAQLLLRSGARVIGIDPNVRQQARARQLGVATVLTPGPQLADALRELSGGRGVDGAIELSGHPAAAGPLLEGLTVEGTLLAAAWYGRREVALPLGGHFHRGRLRIRSTQVGGLPPEIQPRWDRARRSATVAGLLPQLALAPLISHRIPFGDAVAAYQLLLDGAADAAQIVLTYDDRGVDHV